MSISKSSKSYDKSKVKQAVTITHYQPQREQWQEKKLKSKVVVKQNTVHNSSFIPDLNISKTKNIDARTKSKKCYHHPTMPSPSYNNPLKIQGHLKDDKEKSKAFT